MEYEFTVAEAKNKLPSIIHSVEKGPIARITRHGRTVAVLLSVEEYDRLRRKTTGLGPALHAFRERIKQEGIEISGEEFEGLRDTTPDRRCEIEW